MNVRELIEALEHYVLAGAVDDEAPVDIELRRVSGTATVVPLGTFEIGGLNVTPIQPDVKVGRIGLTLALRGLTIKA